MASPPRLSPVKSAVIASISLVVLAFGCGNSDSEDTGAGSGGTAGTSATGGTGGGADSQECKDFEAAASLEAACEFVVYDCPATLDQFLTHATELGSFGYSVVEADGLREVRAVSTFGGHAFSFDEAGMLAGWEAWSDTTYGPCWQVSYEQGRILGDYISTPPGVHRCDLAHDALETGELCDCPCPQPPPEDGIHDGSDECLVVGTWPKCLPTFAQQRDAASNVGATMRSGCGVRTITLWNLDCAYDDAGTLLGGERHRGEDERDECPGVDAYRSGAPPVECEAETTCYFGPAPPAGSEPCPEGE